MDEILNDNHYNKINKKVQMEEIVDGNDDNDNDKNNDSDKSG